MDWRDEYKSKLVSVEEAVREIKSGERVSIPVDTEPADLIRALFARKDELKDVIIHVVAAATDPGWFDAGCEDVFKIDFINYVGGIGRRATDAKRATFTPDVHHLMGKIYREERRGDQRKDLDALLIKVTPPNEQGYVNIGPGLWWKKLHAKRAKKVIVQVDKMLPWCFGDTLLHVSEIHRFAEVDYPEVTDEDAYRQLDEVIPDPARRDKIRLLIPGIYPAMRSSLIDTFAEHIRTLPAPLVDSILDFALRVLGAAEPTEVERSIWGYASTMIDDGDCIQVGVGTPSAYCARVGALDNKVDLGYHSEMTARGIAKYVEAGVINGKRKNLMPGKAIASAWTGASWPDLQIINQNPKFEQYDPTWTEDPRVVSQNDNQVALQNAICIDLTGQVNAETGLGGRLINGLGGQLDMILGALLSKGGRSIHMIRSTALGGAVSSIIPQLEQGMVVTTPRGLVDYVITEHGIANLLGKNERERANELIAIAHPDYRAELKKEAQKLFYPSS